MVFGPSPGRAVYSGHPQRRKTKNQSPKTNRLRNAFLQPLRAFGDAQLLHEVVDVAFHHAGQVVFVEVRTRRGTEQGTPEESITPAKQARLVALAYAYLDAHKLPAESPWRIDVVAVVVDRAGRVARLTHLADAVEE